MKTSAHHDQFHVECFSKQNLLVEYHISWTLSNVHCLEACSVAAIPRTLHENKLLSCSLK